MIIDSGFRCHLTSFARATAAAPSVFVTKLRKYLRTRRVTSVAQVGTDRIIEIQFSGGQYRLFLEFYAGGNIVLVDKDLVVLALLRIVGKEADQEELRVGLKYSLTNRQNYNGIPALTEERVRDGLQKFLDRADGDVKAAKKAKKKSGDVLRKALATSLNEFPPMLIDHALRVTCFDSSIGVEDILKEPTKMHSLMLVLKEAQNVIGGIMSMNAPRGYIVAKSIAAPNSASKNKLAMASSSDNSASNRVLYEDFHPFLPKQFEDNPDLTVLQYDGFNKTVDEFFSSIEGQKLESRLSEREENAKKKLEAARQDHEKRLGGLQQAQEIHVRKAQAIEANLQKVQEALAAINGLIAQGMDWVEIARLIEMEQARHNPVAEIIKLPLKLYENTATLLLEEPKFDDDEDFEGNETDSDVAETDDEDIQQPKPSKTSVKPDTRLAIDVDLSLSPWSNARQYYEQKKVAAVKEQKTLQSSEKALKNTERKVNADLKKGLKQEKQVLRPVRQQLWFEKFNYFISSENYLVLGGRDAQQNEILYRRHLRKGDVYVHADLQGSSTVIIKNFHGRSDDPIPPSTLSQAGTLAVATSSAWDSKAVMSAWWVNAGQVLKTLPSGEYLAVGLFAIKGQKNFLPPAQLMLGFGIMFQISEESKARHLKNRLRDEDSTFKGNHIVELNDAIASLGNTEEKDDNASEVDGTDDEINSDSEDENTRANVSTAQNASANNEDEHGSDMEEYQNPLQPKRINIDDAVSQNAEDALAARHVSPTSEVIGGLNDEEQRVEAPEAELGLSADYRDDISSNSGRLSNQQDHITPRNNSPDPHQGNYTEQSIDQNDVSPSPITTSSSALKPSEPIGGPKPYVRGKHGKYQKMKAKYANQDEEDRALALRLLGSQAGQEKAKENVAAKKAREQHLQAEKQRRRQQHVVAVEEGKAIEEKRQQKFQEGADSLDDENVHPPVDLEAFVGSLMPGDEVLDALVLCAPWDAIGSRCTWRAKLQPGTLKKGKAVREILQRWTTLLADREKKKRPGAGNNGNETMIEEERIRGREAELLRNLREVEVVGVVPVGKCRVVMGGGGGGDAGGSGKSGGGGRGSAPGKGKRGGKGSKRQR